LRFFFIGLTALTAKLLYLLFHNSPAILANKYPNEYPPRRH